MSMTDPIADMLTRIRNGSTARHSTVEIPASKMKAEIARLMTEQGYIAGYDKKQGEHGEIIVVELKYAEEPRARHLRHQACLQAWAVASTPRRRRCPRCSAGSARRSSPRREAS